MQALNIERWLCDVQVKVPDPDIVVSLEKSQATVDDLQSRIAALQEENEELRARLDDLTAGVAVAPVAAAAVVQVHMNTQ